MSTKEEQTPQVEKKEKKKEKKEKKDDDRTKLEFEVVQEGFYGRHPRDFNKVLIIQSAEECKSAGIQSHVISSTKFETHLLLYVASGQKPTGGYKVKVKRVYQHKNGDIEIYAKDVSPTSQFTTMALTQPFTVVRVARTDLQIPQREYPVKWMRKDKKGGLKKSK